MENSGVGLSDGLIAEFDEVREFVEAMKVGFCRFRLWRVACLRGPGRELY
jgi:hypothetical protein